MRNVCDFWPVDPYDRRASSNNPYRPEITQLARPPSDWRGVPLHLEHGLRAVLERLPGDRMRLHWILVDADGVRGLGTFEGTKVEVMAQLKRGPGELAAATDTLK
jgi:hypothetical protein